MVSVLGNMDHELFWSLIFVVQFLNDPYWSLIFVAKVLNDLKIFLISAHISELFQYLPFQAIKSFLVDKNANASVVAIQLLPRTWLVAWRLYFQCPLPIEKSKKIKIKDKMLIGFFWGVNLIAHSEGLMSWLMS